MNALTAVAVGTGVGILLYVTAIICSAELRTHGRHRYTDHHGQATGTPEVHPRPRTTPYRPIVCGTPAANYRHAPNCPHYRKDTP